MQMTFHNSHTFWHYFAFCGFLLIVPQFATTCVTLQNSHRPGLLWHYFCAAGFGLTDARITDISNDKVGHRGSLLCDPSLWDYPPSPRPYCSILRNRKFLTWVFSSALFGIAISTFRITPLNQLINWFEMTRYVQLSNYAWLKALISDAIEPKFSQMKSNSLMQFDSGLKSHQVTITQTSERVWEALHHLCL